MSDLAVIALACIAAILLAVWIARRRKPRKKVPASVGAFGWALLFLTSGRMPPPPPQSQIEQEAHEKKNRESSRADSS
jgi:hypothetical protein